jgi:hypothetical protein
MARHVDGLARWWTSASQEARFALLRQSLQENTPPWQALRLAIIASEVEAGEVSQG